MWAADHRLAEVEIKAAVDILTPDLDLHPNPQDQTTPLIGPIEDESFYFCAH